MIFALYSGCQSEQINSNLCDDEYFIYSGELNEKIYFKQSQSEIWIVFENDQLSKELAEDILSKYPFLEVNQASSNYNQLGVRIKMKENVNDCRVIQDYLLELNSDDEIFSATPIFYFAENDPESYLIILSEILTKNKNDVIVESDFIDFAEDFGLELIEANYSTQYFRIKEVKTGFESLEIAKHIYESGKVEYSQPNFIAKYGPN
jgi:hypothetical protein